MQRFVQQLSGQVMRSHSARAMNVLKKSHFTPKVQCNTCVLLAPFTSARQVVAGSLALLLLQGYAEDTESSRINKAVSTAHEDDSSQPSGWQPSSNALLGLVALKHRMSLLGIYDSAAAS